MRSAFFFFKQKTAYEIVILAVEPQVLDSVLDDLRSVLTEAKLILSVAAGYPIRRIVAHLSPSVRVIRCMPNTPSEVQAGVSAIALGGDVSREDERLARAVFESVGKGVLVDRSGEHTSELQSRPPLVCRLLLGKKKKYKRVHVCRLG